MYNSGVSFMLVHTGIGGGARQLARGNSYTEYVQIFVGRKFRGFRG